MAEQLFGFGVRHICGHIPITVRMVSQISPKRAVKKTW